MRYERSFVKCDRCGAEFEEENNSNEYHGPIFTMWMKFQSFNGAKTFDNGDEDHHLCIKCEKEFIDWFLMKLPKRDDAMFSQEYSELYEKYRVLNANYEQLKRDSENVVKNAEALARKEVFKTKGQAQVKKEVDPQSGWTLHFCGHCGSRFQRYDAEYCEVCGWAAVH